jgi:hypothetical protein
MDILNGTKCISRFYTWDISSAHGAHIKSNPSILDPILIREIRR